MRSEVLYEGPTHRWVVMGRDPKKRDEVIDTNEYAVVTPNGTLLPDPGGIEIFPRVLSELTRYCAVDDVVALFASHQDPDIVSSLPMWLDLCPNVKTYVSWMWTSFIAHFAMGRAANIIEIPDEGMPIPIGNARLQAVPAHYCHASGNFGLFDPTSRILFSGDVGAALLPSHETSLFVENFDQHVGYMRGFHQRWMPSTPALRSWSKRVRALNPSMICPQHGAIFRGEDVGRFLDWLDVLEVGRLDGFDAQSEAA
ncbi:MAG: MBL fold metallo-hydrolase [Deltaproteobacteria bacterium]|jgi:flavorubredoxin